MLITILTGGTRGDTQPYIALGLELKRAGYDVRVAAFERYETFVKSFQLEFFPIIGDISSVASSDNLESAMKADNPLKVLLSFRKLRSLVYDLQKDFFKACEGSDAIIYHPGATMGYFAAQFLKIPSILATPFPMTATKEYPALIFYKSRLARSFNFKTHKIFEKIMWFASKSPVKRFWKNKFGTSPENFESPFSKQTTKTKPTLISCSQFVFPRPKDWPENVYSTGYWFLDGEESWKPSEELIDFLKSGDPPVYVGFGSISDTKKAGKTTRIIVDALEISGKRGILATGWKGLSNIEKLPEEIFVLESAPHSWLFPKMAAVVHHGGAGTTAAGLRAGIPSIIIPHTNDQFGWGQRIFELGVGAKPIPRKKLSSKELAKGILYALTQEVTNSAKGLGEKIEQEKGTETAVKIIDGCLK